MTLNNYIMIFGVKPIIFSGGNPVAEFVRAYDKSDNRSNAILSQEAWNELCNVDGVLIDRDTARINLAIDSGEFGIPLKNAIRNCILKNKLTQTKN